MEINKFVNETIKPWSMYTLGHMTLNFTSISASNGGKLDSSLDDTMLNTPFIGITNAIYTPFVNYAIDKAGRWGANLVSLGTTLGFYSYTLVTNDNDPTIPSTIAGGLGLILTNIHTNDRLNIRGEEK